MRDLISDVITCCAWSCDSGPRTKWPILCRVGRLTLLTHPAAIRVNICQRIWSNHVWKNENMEITFYINPI